MVRFAGYSLLEFTTGKLSPLTQGSMTFWNDSWYFARVYCCWEYADVRIVLHLKSYLC